MGERRRQLLQNYEDAKLALLLDEYAEVYGKISTELYERDVAAGKIRPITDQELEAQLNDVLQRAEAEESRVMRKGARLKGIGRNIAIVAVSIVTFFFLMFTVQAAGIDIFGAVGKWTDSIFHFVSDSEDTLKATEDRSPVLVMNDTMIAQGIPSDLVPHWLPSGFEITELSIAKNNDVNSLTAMLENNDGQWILIQIDENRHAGPFNENWIEKDNEIVETIVSNGRSFYLFMNDSVWSGVFQDERYRISIIDSDGKDSLKTIIQSIGVLNDVQACN